MPNLSFAAAWAIFPLAAVCSLVASTGLVSRLDRLAGSFGLPEALLGLVVALGADSPEITSAITASAEGHRTVGTGVVVGSNVFNIAALLGLSALVAGSVRLHRRVVLFDGVAAAWVALATLLALLARLGAATGLVLVLLVVVPYVVISAAPRGRFLERCIPRGTLRWLAVAVAEEEADLKAVLGYQHGRPVQTKDVVAALTGLGAVVLASAVMVTSAQSLGSHYGVPQLVLGGVVLAAVTSLPNAVGAVYLAIRGRGAAVLSEAMNSNMLNVVAGLFLPGMFVGIGASGKEGTLVAGWYLGMTVLVVLMAFGSGGLRRVQGATIVVAYAGFVAVAIAVG
ncbi:MAG TPA: hypothetical protein VME20_04100 [Acidimicrobiales bacterium]|nr:hypothetical protein [Acidimicrobiales bacterium]